MNFKQALELTKEIKKLKGVLSVLYVGSSDFDTLNDVGLIVIYSNKVESSLEQVNKLAQDKSKIKQVTLDELGSNSELKAAISGEGVLLHGKAVEVTAESLKLKSRVILTYDTTEMSQNERNKLNRALYGGISTYRKDGERIVKEYMGMVEKVNAQKLGKGVLMVDRFNASMIIQTLKTFKAKWKEIPVWTY